MGRTYKRDPDDIDMDDVDFDDDFDTDDDLIDLEERSRAPRRGVRARDTGRTSSLSRSLPDDWQDFDYGGGDDRDAGLSVWR